ncbi:MAG: Mut7-C RNAse domain-containing protein [Desulfobacterales bacterium]
MAKVTYRFYEELNDYLPQHIKKVDVEAKFIGKRAIKETIEDFGVPPAQVDLVLVNGEPVDFGYILKDGDRVSVYPVFERLNIRHVSLLRRFPLRQIRFIADVDKKDIVQPMRVLGFDMIFSSSYDTLHLIDISKKQKRIILTTRKELLKSKFVTHAVKIGSGTIMEQIKKVIDDLDIKDRIKPFSRCVRCNNPLENRQTIKILDNISPETKHILEKYLLCKSCRKKDRQKSTCQREVDIIRL